MPLNLFEKIEYSNRESIIKRIIQDSKDDKGYYFLLGVSVVITTLGLVLNSAAVIIGGMIISPLLYPIIAIGTAIITGNERMLFRVLTLVVKSTLLSVLVAVLVTIVSPSDEPTHEILTRTAPNLIDLLVALTSGAAGAYAVCVRERLVSLMGVAVAAAIVPPLAIVGYGIATVSWSLVGGAFLLYFANLIAVIVATVVVFYLLGFTPGRKTESKLVAKRDFVISAVLFLLVGTVLSYFLLDTIKQAQRMGAIEEEIRIFLKTYDNTTLISLEEYENVTGSVIRITLRSPSELTQRAVNILDDQIEGRIEEEVDLQILLIPVTKLVDD